MSQEQLEEVEIKEEPVRQEKKKLGIFEKYLTLWVFVCMGIGTGIGIGLPGVSDALSGASVYEINIPTAVLLWIMIFPMMLNIDWASIIHSTRRYIKPTIITAAINYCIQPFSMYAFALLFLKVAFSAHLGSEETRNEYIAGLCILGAAPCTAMVFVWSYLLDGDPTSTLVQVAVNDLIMLAAFAPTVKLLVNSSGIQIPIGTVFAAVGFFVLIPLLLSLLARFSFPNTLASRCSMISGFIPYCIPSPSSLFCSF